jgi:hypothetical protein
MLSSYFLIKPEAVGHFGDGTVADWSRHPPSIQRLHCVFDGWLGDDLLASYPVFLVTDRLRAALETPGLSGISFEDCAVSTSKFFDQTRPGRPLPRLWWMKVFGRAGTDDVGLSQDDHLVVSPRVMAVLMRHRLGQALILQHETPRAATAAPPAPALEPIGAREGKRPLET